MINCNLPPRRKYEQQKHFLFIVGDSGHSQVWTTAITMLASFQLCFLCSTDSFAVWIVKINNIVIWITNVCNLWIPLFNIIITHNSRNGPNENLWLILVLNLTWSECVSNINNHTKNFYINVKSHNVLRHCSMFVGKDPRWYVNQWYEGNTWLKWTF